PARPRRALHRARLPPDRGPGARPRDHRARLLRARCASQRHHRRDPRPHHRGARRRADERALVSRVPTRLQAVYHVRCDAQSAEERASAIAVEQSVEMPLSAITDDFVRAEIVGRVEVIAEKASGLYEVHISLAAETVADDPGQLINMLFGNT